MRNELWLALLAVNFRKLTASNGYRKSEPSTKQKNKTQKL